ncbi:MAG TPA: hypothetical protein VFX28_23835, partial [Methylomirabilota bacterium]|nr:hypothetical protein [Methylomirabilota bacterium]
MTRTLAAALALAAALTAAPVRAAEPPPLVVHGQPRLVWVPEWAVWVLEGHDVVYHRSAYYYHHGGRWYAASA